MKYQEMLVFYNYLKTQEGSQMASWNQAIDSIEELMTAMLPYEDADDFGNYKPINEANYQRLNAIFDRAVNSTKAFLDEAKNSNLIDDEPRYALTKNFNKEFLAKAYVEFKNVKPNPKQSLHEAMEHFRYENVELSNDDLKRVGNNLSSRIQLTIDLDGKPTKGIFTKAVNYNPVQQFHNVIADMKNRYRAYESFFATLDNERFYNDCLSAVSVSYFYRPNGVVLDTDDVKNDVMERFKMGLEYPGSNAMKAEFEKYQNDPDFFNALFDFANKIEPINASIGINTEVLELQKDDRIDNRNCAMSSVANLLGINDLIAKSKQLSVKMPDGTYQTGTFMEFVESKDIANLDIIDEMRVYGLDAYDNKEVKMQLANLQVLDYICGNVDRHLGNILYQFDNKAHKLVGIKGIDNDASFMRANLEKGEGANELPNIYAMRVINKTMADKILSLDEGMLSATLHGYGLSDQEVKSAWNRLKDLQDEIKEADIYDKEKGLRPYDQFNKNNGNKLTIVNEEDWDSLNLNDIKAPKNVFEKLINAQKILTGSDPLNPKFKCDAEVAKRSLKAMLKDENAEKMLADLKSAKPIMGTSKRYLNVIKALEEYKNTKAPDNLLDKDNSPKFSKLLDLKEAINFYKKEKIELGHIDENGKILMRFGDKAIRRIKSVDEIEKFADKLLEQKNIAIKADKIYNSEVKKNEDITNFKNKPIEEQQALIDEKNKKDAEKNMDISLRLKKSLDHDDKQFEASFDSSELQMDDLNASM